MMTAKETLKRCGLPAMAAVCAVALMFLAACEDDPDMGNTEGYFNSNPYAADGRSEIAIEKDLLAVSPGSAGVTTVGQMFTFKVSGGYPPYQWRVANSDVGTVASTDGNTDTAIYKASAIEENTIYVVDSGGRAASVSVSLGGAAVVLRIIPDEGTVNQGNQFTFTGIGGAGAPASYYWTIGNQAVGSIVDNGDGTATYTAGGVDATNDVYLTDADGTVDIATIVQE